MLKPILQDRILYPEILWQRPINVYHKKGRILVLGGEKDFRETLLFCEALYKADIQKLSLGFPDGLLKTYKNILPVELQLPLPSTLSGTFSISAFDAIKKASSDYDLVVMGVGITKNRETQDLLKNILAIDKPTVLDKSVVDAFIDADLSMLKKSKAIYFVDKALAGSILKKREKTFSESQIANFNELATTLQNVVVLVDSDTLISDSSRMVLTKNQPSYELLLLATCALWSWNIRKPFESACTAAYVAKTWQNNSLKIDQLQKAIELAEHEVERGKAG